MLTTRLPTCMSDVFPTILEFSFKDLQTLSSRLGSNYLTVNSAKTQALLSDPLPIIILYFLIMLEWHFSDLIRFLK